MITQTEIDKLYERLNLEAKPSGYHINPDTGFAKELIKGLITNERRYGYQTCPCRLASGDKTEDLDIICPCDYRDADVAEYDACYCALYVSGGSLKDKPKITSIPERRPPQGKRQRKKTEVAPARTTSGQIKLPLPVWRCKICGYLCARDEPPEVCPVCKARKERFERFI